MRPEQQQKKTCLIVGAGLSGLTAARALRDSGWRVHVVDKGRNPGGRMATRRKEPLVFDHGAQFFTARSPEFQTEVARWCAEGWAAPWFGTAEHQRFRSVDGMNGLAARLALGLEPELGVAVRRISAFDGRWSASIDEHAPIPADAVIVTAPAPQAAVLLDEVLPAGPRQALADISYDPCLALMVALEGPSAIPGAGYFRWDDDGGGPLAVISDNTKKGISPGPAAALTIHTTAQFARTHWDSPPDDIAPLLLEAAHPYLGAPVKSWQFHRWRYSQPVTLHASPCLPVETGGAPLVIAGDAFGGPRVEGAFLSGRAAARWILEHS